MQEMFQKQSEPDLDLRCLFGLFQPVTAIRNYKTFEPEHVIFNNVAF